MTEIELTPEQKREAYMLSYINAIPYDYARELIALRAVADAAQNAAGCKVRSLGIPCDPDCRECALYAALKAAGREG